MQIYYHFFVKISRGNVREGYAIKFDLLSYQCYDYCAELSK